MAAHNWRYTGAPQSGTVTSVAIAADDKPVIYIGSKIGLFVSTDTTDTAKPAWKRLVKAPIGIMALALSPDFKHDLTIVIGTESGIYVSTDAGNNWIAGRLPSSKSMVLTLCFSPAYSEDGIIVAGTLEDGVWISHTRGAQWSAGSFGMLDACVYSLVCSPTFSQDETIYAGTETAVYMSYNASRAWKQVEFAEHLTPAISIAVSPTYAEDHTVYAGTEHSGLYKSSDRGRSWNRLPLEANTVNALAWTSKGTLVAATANGIYQSAVNGDTWQHAAAFADALCLSTHGEVVVAGQADSGLWIVSCRRTGSRRHHLAVPPLRTVTGMALSPAFQQDGTAFIYGPQEGLFASTDKGKTWVSRNASLPGIDIQELLVSPRFAENGILASASPDGLYVSRDAGDQWQPVTGAAPSCMAFSHDGRRLCIYSSNGGMQVTSDLGETWSNIAAAWDTGGRVLAVAVTDDLHFFAVYLSGAAEHVSLWQGTPGRLQEVFRGPATTNPIARIYIPSVAQSPGYWLASAGRKIWKVTASSSDYDVRESVFAADVVALTGKTRPSDVVLFACTQRRLYKSNNGVNWIECYDFGDETVLSFSLNPAYPRVRRGYAMMLGGAFWSGRI